MDDEDDIESNYLLPDYEPGSAVYGSDPDNRAHMEHATVAALSTLHKNKRQLKKKLVKDLPIMGTNDCSIVSKRSVERYYYSEPHMLRYFVGKPKRRSPLIHRGYWFRMYAIETIVKTFLDELSDKRKVILNLGCGYDSLPFQMLAKESDLCSNATFVDVDYPELMMKKSQLVRDTAALRDLLNKVSIEPSGGDVSLRSEQYIAIGCDLSDIGQLDALLRQQLDLPICTILVLAEVSITYMDADAADELIRYTGGLGDVRFCLLEQFLPAGPEHPFARQMMVHFNSLSTPLRSIYRYPQLKDQERRFTDREWRSATARSLWDLWSDPHFITAREKISLNSIEAFDEWEEFALFASHYFLLVASNTVRGNAVKNCMEIISLGSTDSLTSTTFNGSPSGGQEPTRISIGGSNSPGQTSTVEYRNKPNRRFGVLYQSSEDNFCHHGGYGEQGRVKNADMYVANHFTFLYDPPPPPVLDARMCHTVTTFPQQPGTDYTNRLIVGGRSSPYHALGDCWFQRNRVWERAQELPQPLYRHCATLVTDANGDKAVLIYGGKSSNGVVMNDFLLWRYDSGWTKLKCTENRLTPRFGAAMSSDGVACGLLLGGMAEDGTIVPEFWRWYIDFSAETPEVEVTAHFHKSAALQQLICRFGTCLTPAPCCLYLVGGISRSGILPHEYSIVKILSSDPFDIEPAYAQPNLGIPAFLLIGHSSIWDADGLVIVGGGAVCFSFGNHSNNGAWKVFPGNWQNLHNPWTLIDQRDRSITEEPPQKQAKLTLNQKSSEVVVNQSGPTLSPVRRECMNRTTTFRDLVYHSEPVVIERLKLESCSTSWTTEYLKRKIGRDREVTVHESDGQAMNFQRKNFRYVRKPFGKFIDDISAGKMQYLRSLSKDGPADTPANFTSDFESISEDFQVPVELSMVMENFHSSVLRISGPVAMWLHYDVMANVLCQLRGTKRLLLYPPSDLLHLKIPHGESSSTINAFDPDPADRDTLSQTSPVETILRPGEVLFIPPLWSHTACPVNGISVSVNVFFHSFNTGYAAGRDVYGNRDVQAYEDGRRDVQRIFKRFSGLPEDIRRSYVQRLAKELEEMPEP
ncbi:tRNA methyltransferase ppm2 [Trapelia coarctata]|nr:tRNA methyltransferase ppm2 [Trapelia coarctata]